VTSRDRVDRVKHSTRILRPPHPIKLGNLPDPRVRVERINSIELKLNPTITLVITRMTMAHRDRFLEASIKNYVFVLFVSSAISRAFIVVEKILSFIFIIIITTISLYE